METDAGIICVPICGEGEELYEEPDGTLVCVPICEDGEVLEKDPCSGEYECVPECKHEPCEPCHPEPEPCEHNKCCKNLCDWEVPEPSDLPDVIKWRKLMRPFKQKFEHIRNCQRCCRKD